MYINSDGEFKEMTYTLGKSVPSSAEFTDTKVTDVNNHYTPTENTNSQIDAPEGEAVIGLKRDSAGHVVGVITSSLVAEEDISAMGFTKNTGTITDVTVNGSSVATSGVANIPTASITAYGVTKLTSSTNSTSTTLAATASAVKAAYDLANSFVPMTLNTSTSSFGTSIRWAPNQKYASTVALANNVTFNIDVSSINTTKDNTWSLSFILGTSARTISFTVSQTGYTIMWANGVAPTFEPNTAYEITFKLVGTNLFGVCGAFRTV